MDDLSRKHLCIIPYRNRKTLNICKESLSQQGLHVKVVEQDNDFMFWKSALLNEGLTETANIYSIIDVDMIYSPIFEITTRNIPDYYVYFANGYKLTKEYSPKVLDDNIKFNDIDVMDGTSWQERVNTDRRVISSQITFTHKTLELFYDILGVRKLYNEAFTGWGREDALVTYLIHCCNVAGLIGITHIDRIWYHLWHDQPARNPDNDKIFNSEKKFIEQKVKEYANKKMCMR